MGGSLILVVVRMIVFASKKFGEGNRALVALFDPLSLQPTINVKEGYNTPTVSGSCPKHLHGRRKADSG